MSDPLIDIEGAILNFLRNLGLIKQGEVAEKPVMPEPAEIATPNLPAKPEKEPKAPALPLEPRQGDIIPPLEVAQGDQMPPYDPRRPRQTTPL